MTMDAVTVLDAARMDAQTKREVGYIQIKFQQAFIERFWGHEQLIGRFTMISNKIFSAAKDGWELADLGYWHSKTPKEIVDFLNDYGFDYKSNGMTEIVSWSNAKADTVAGELLKDTIPCQVERIRRKWREKLEYEKATKIKVGKVSVRLIHVPDQSVIEGLKSNGFAIEYFGNKGIKVSKIA